MTKTCHVTLCSNSLLVVFQVTEKSYAFLRRKPIKFTTNKNTSIASHSEKLAMFTDKTPG